MFVSAKRALCRVVFVQPKGTSDSKKEVAYNPVFGEDAAYSDDHTVKLKSFNPCIPIKKSYLIFHLHLIFLFILNNQSSK